MGNLLKVIDANGNPTAYHYDPVNNLVMVADALGNSTTYGYDGNNNRVSFANAKGNQTTYAYDSLNRRTKVTDPMGFSAAYSYDAVGSVVSLLDANGKTDAFSYDTVNRPVTRSYADGTVIGFSYDSNGNRTSMTDSHGTTTYSYDARNRATSVSSPGGQAVKYAYDGIGHRTSLEYPDGRLAIYSYDRANRLSQVTDWNGDKTTYGYDPVGNRISVTLGNGSTTNYAYDGAERLTSLLNGTKNRVLTSFLYGLDAVGNRTQLVDASGGVTLYGYDALNRLTSWTPPYGRATSYGYDVVGNRTSQAGVNGNTSYIYDSADRLLTAGTTSFTYDANGNRLRQVTGGTTTAYGWDSLNRLISVAGGGANSHYAYDGDGNRILQQVTTGSYQYLNDVATRLPVALNENGPDGNIDYAFGLSLLSEDVGGKDFYYQFDGIGSVVTVTNHAGAHQANYNYDPWGQNIQPTVPPIGLDALGTENKVKFTGEALDPQTNLYYLRARYYDPAIGRFISKDPLTGSANFPLSHNRYAYALANPLALADPSGLAATPSGDLSGGGFVRSGAIISTLLAGGFGFVGSGPGIPVPGPTHPPQQSGPPYTSIKPPPGDFPAQPYNDCDFEPCNGDSIFPGNAITPPGLFGWPFSDIFNTPEPQFGPPTCGIYDVCNEVDQQAPITSGQIDVWNNTSNGGFASIGGPTDDGWGFTSGFDDIF